MIHAYGQPDPPVPRLLAAMRARGHSIGAAPGGEKHDASTLVLAGGSKLDPLALGVLLGAWRSAPGARILVISRLGAHPDAQAKSLRELWTLEEHARASGLAVLTLRLAPLVGPNSPLWLKLRQRPWIPRSGRSMLNPVAESDVVETLDRALRGQVAWDGWYEVAGPEAFALGELADWAKAAGVPREGGRGAWEPPLIEMLEHRLAEPDRWREKFGITPRPLAEQAKEWA